MSDVKDLMKALEDWHEEQQEAGIPVDLVRQNLVAIIKKATGLEM